MKIFLVIPSLGSGGAERVMSILANEWVKKSDCIIDLVLLSADKDFYDVDPRITIHRLGYVGGRGMVSKLLGALQGVLKFRALLKKQNPDVVLSFIREANIFTLISAVFTDVNVVISERDSSSFVVSPMYSLLRKITYQWAHGIIVQTEQYKNFIASEIGNKKIKVIPNPVKKIEFREVEKELIILNVGRLIKEKGQSYLLRAFEKSRNSMNWQLIFLGDGPLRDGLVDEARRLGISERVHFLGAKKDIDAWLNKASIFAFPSVSEGFPNALAEAMSAGLPCVSFDCVAGPKDLISDGVNGFLIEVGDVDGFAMRLDDLMSSGDLRQQFSIAAKEIAKKLEIGMISDEYYSFLLDN